MKYNGNVDSVANQRIKREFVNREVLCCDTSVVEYILRQENFTYDDVPFTYEDIENLYPDNQDEKSLPGEAFRNTSRSSGPFHGRVRQVGTRHPARRPLP